MENIPERINYLPQKRLEKEGVSKVGVGIFIIDVDTGKIWTIRENHAKASTRRTPGTISIPLETAKQGEHIANNTKGALAEFRPLQRGEELVWCQGASYKGRYVLTKGVAADIIILGLTNRQPETTLATQTSETDAVGWRDLDDLLAEPNLREGVGGLLRLASQERWIEDFVATAQTTARNQTLKNNSELEVFLQARESQPDYGDSSQ